MRGIKILAALALAAVVAGTWIPVFGSSLASIGVLDPVLSPYSEARAVSSDGTYVVGTSTETDGIRVPIVWSSGDGLVALPNPSGQNSIALGVAVGVNTNAGNILVSGLHEGNLTGRYYKAPLSNLTNGTWADIATVGGLGATGNFRDGTANDLRNDLSVGDGRYYIGGRRADNNKAARLRVDPTIGWDGTVIRSVGSVSGYGVVVGRSANSGSPSVSSAFYEGPDEAYDTVPGSTGVRADGIGISPSFGKSASTDLDVQWICGQLQNYGDGTFFQAFRWKRGDTSMTFLGALPGDTSSVAYTVADNGVTAGRSHNINTSVETAVVWDTSGTWDATGTPQSVQALLNAAGVDTSEWSSLIRVYAASDDGRVLAGFGVWAADGSTRGFVATVTATVPPVTEPRITSIAGAGTGSVTVYYTNTLAGTNYTLQYNTNLNTINWTTVGSQTAAGTSDSQTDASATSDQRYYRVYYVTP